MNLADVLGDKPIERPAIVDEPATDEKPAAGEPEAAAAPSVATEVPAEKPAEPSTQRDEQGRFAKKPDHTVPLTALEAERRRRQELEAELARFREHKPKTDFFEDPNKAFEERVSEYVAPLRNELMNLRLERFKERHEDFDEVVVLALQKAQTDAVLRHQFDSAPNEEAALKLIYREGKLLKELGDVDRDIGKYREKVLSEHQGKLTELEARLKALEAENATLKASQAKAAKIPQSLNSEPSAAQGDVMFTGPKPLKSIFS